MVSRIAFSDYRRLKYIELNDLAQVNFLVGENDSGKSRILEYIDEDFGPRSIIMDEESRIALLDEDDTAFFENLDSVDIVIIDNPETGLHPSLQKEIAQTLKKMATKFKLQIFVATHSPFVISGSAHTTYTELQNHQESRKEFKTSQKVYFVRDGEITDRYGEGGLTEYGTRVGSYGYWGFKAYSIAQKMLGAGLSDLIPPQQSVPSNDSPILVFCEGQGKEEDAKIYNQIFHKYIPNIIFLSSRGSSQLSQTFEIMREIKVGLSVNARYMMLQDRDHMFSNLDAIERYEEEHRGVKILHRRALECYIYTSEALASFLKSHGLVLSAKNRRKLNTLQRVIQLEAESGELGSSYKNRLKDMTKFILKDSGYWKSSRPVSIKFLGSKLAQHITPGTKAYRELKKIIYGNSSHWV